MTIAGWMADPVFCAGMTIGSPQVDLAVLVDLSELVTPAARSSNSRSEQGIAWVEEGNEASRHVGKSSRMPPPPVGIPAALPVLRSGDCNPGIASQSPNHRVK
ncbi:hypothetical protein GCM10011341_10020 [Frigidibacter albus]|uniref:hypothetical protein n=1 Tax=Frigidibacter albus TaxID=1465486 RepID=UPI00198A5C8D|nr:hypothetical protein [Frigidibacter albus]GGH48363.1 hypothetical protein GCM10011341_10020 [Frigidibacter albus]